MTHFGVANFFSVQLRLFFWKTKSLLLLLQHKKLLAYRNSFWSSLENPFMDTLEVLPKRGWLFCGLQNSKKFLDVNSTREQYLCYSTPPWTVLCYSNARHEQCRADSELLRRVLQITGIITNLTELNLAQGSMVGIFGFNFLLRIWCMIREFLQFRLTRLNTFQSKTKF